MKRADQTSPGKTRIINLNICKIMIRQQSFYKSRREAIFMENKKSCDDSLNIELF